MKRGSADIVLLLITVFLSIFGIIMIFSASSYAAVLQYGVSNYHFALKQAIVVILGFALSLFIMHIPTDSKIMSHRFLTLVSLAMIASMFLLAAYGSISHNAKSWIKVGTMAKLQPSEFAKTIIILYMASAFGKVKKFKSMYDPFMYLIIPVFLVGAVFMEPDRGTALIMACIVMFIFFTLPFDKNKYFKIVKTGALVLAAFGIVCLVFFKDTIASVLGSSEATSRFTYTNPCSRYLEDTGYQVCNGYIAINNGGLFGVGLGKSTQKYLYLPEAHTDFIFAIIVEELGVITGAIILVLYVVLLFRILVIARNASTLKGSIIAFGTFAYILIHIMVNLGGLLALIPLTGVPLPFLSYGGSFMMNMLILLAFTQRVAIETKQKRRDIHE